MPHRSVALFNSTMALQEGFEPPTDGLEGRCSIQLSYCNNNMSALLIITKTMLNVKPNYLQTDYNIVSNKIRFALINLHDFLAQRCFLH